MKEHNGYQITAVLWLILSRLTADVDLSMYWLCVVIGCANLVLFVVGDVEEAFNRRRETK